AFAVHGDPNEPTFEVPNIGLRGQESLNRLDDRMRLRQRLDGVSRQVERLEKQGAFDTFQRQAWNVLAGPAGRPAFYLGLGAARVRERYGRHTWGQRCLLGP